MIEEGTFLQNRYRVQKQIGQGGMGAVYLATDERFGSAVAIKETLFADENYRKALGREARLLNSLRHPALPVVSDYFVEGNGQYIVMEYIGGEDLAEQLMKNGKPFPPEDVLIWANQLLDALEFLHNQEIPIIHRDIKPQNLKLNKQGQIILLDFGLAKGNPADVSHHTAAKSIFGYSPGYASLEQIQGTGTDPRSDLYSLAATLYHLLTGAPPTDALTRAMSVLNEREDPLQPADLINKKVPFGVAQVLQRAMALNSSQRPASAAEMRQILEESDSITEVSDAGTLSRKPLETSIFTQDTKLFSARGAQQSEIKTEVLTGSEINDSDSRETRIVNRKALNTRSAFWGKRYAVGAGIFGVLLLVGVALFALNVLDEHSANRISNQNNASEFKATSADVKVENTNSVGENMASNEDISVKEGKPAADSSSERDTRTTEAPVQKPSETAKNKQKAAKPQKESSAPVIINDPEEGNVKIYDNKIETDEVIIESNRITVKKPGVKVRPLLPEEMKGLTEAQKRRINRLKKMQESQRQNPRYPKPNPNPPPPPKPTPYR